MRPILPSCASLFSLFVATAPSLGLAASQPPLLVAVQEHVAAPAGTRVPRFAVDPSWPHMPETMLWGEVSGVAIDADDSVWLVHRPDSLTKTDDGLSQSPPIALCCRAAPPVTHFSAEGEFLGGFGGPETAPTIDGVNQWPISLHGIFVDSDRTLWFAGIGRGDHVVMNYTQTASLSGRSGSGKRLTAMPIPSILVTHPTSATSETR